MKRPIGVIILGILLVFAGVGGLLSPLGRPVLSFGVIHTEGWAYLFHLLSNLAGLYLGYGLLKSWRHIWQLYLLAAGVRIANLSLNLAHEPKMWELYLLLQSRAAAIPRLVMFTVETHYLSLTICGLTAWYIYLQKPYFWGETE